MPATARGNETAAFAVGVDGCRGGWVAARLQGSRTRPEIRVFETFQGLIREMGVGARAIAVDMPIGLVGRGPRKCEIDARGRLKPKRHSSVFSSPTRPMLDFDVYDDANAFGKTEGAGLSKQAWMITPKIREVDAWISPIRQRRVFEAHPELAFWRLRGERACDHNKKTPEGFAERRRALTRALALDPATLVATAKSDFGGAVARDDIVDALALACTARARLEGDAVQLGGDEKDSRGLKMEIWG